MKDIFPPKNKRSIRNITPPRQTDGVKRVEKDEGTVLTGERKKVRDFKIKENTGEIKSTSPEVKAPDHGRGSGSGGGPFEGKKGTPRSGSGKWKWITVGTIAGLTALLIVGFGISSQFAKAEVYIKPIIHQKDVDEVIEIYKNPASSELGFEIITVDGEEPAETVLEIEGTEQVEQRAYGTITIFNEFSQADQILVQDTRFETPDGLIFRIQEGITVPGMSSDGDPGSVQAEVYADEPGVEYNIGPTEFTIPGFQGSQRFDGFYARSDSPMEGGEKGERAVVDGDKLKSAKEQLRKELGEEIIVSAMNSVPEEFAFFDGLYSLKESFEKKIENNSATLSLSVSLSGILLDKDELANYLYKELSGEDGEVEVREWDNLSFSLIEGVVDKESENFSVAVSGRVDLVEKIRKDELAADLAGIAIKDKDTIESVLDNYPASQAEAEISPFWVRSLPANSDNININIQY